MSASVTILCGPARSAKTARLLGRYREALRSGTPGSTLWLAPNWRVAADVRDQLLDGTLPGCFSPGVMTFAQYAEAVLHAARVPMRSVNPLMKRELIRQIVAAQAKAGRLRHFQSIAKTTGLVNLVCEFVGELKRLEIWPDEFREACQRRGGLADKDRELAEIYDAYQQTLLEHGLFDAEGRFWSARDVLQRGRGGNSPSAIDNPLFPSFVVADGFTDFTRTQHEILEVLALRAEEMLISLPLEPEPRRADLFAKPLATLERLRRRHVGVAIEELPRQAAADWPAMARLERTLFENPRKKGAGARGEEQGAESDIEAWNEASAVFPVDRVHPQQGAPSSSSSSVSPLPSPPSTTPRIEILAAAKQIGEIELIAARIKRLLVEGQARPGEVAVVFRSPQHVAELVDEVFSRFGIPVAFESGQALDRSPALRALATLLQLDADDWPFDRLLAVLGSNYFQPDWPEWRATTPATVERTIRKLQVSHGRKELLEQLCLADDSEESSEPSAGATTGRGPTAAVMERLAAALDALPQHATLPDWAKAWAVLAEETGLVRAIHQSESSASSIPPSPLPSELRVWNRLMEVSAEGDRLSVWLQQRPPELDRDAALAALLDVMANDRIGHSGDESGHVRVLAAESIRSLRIPYVFLAGLSEKVFPPPDREDRLYSEAESARLIEAGLPLVARTERTHEEMLLFYEAVTRATKRLWLSYPALDETAQPLLPSPFLSEVEQAFGPGRLPRTEQTDLSPIPQSDDPLSESDFRVCAIATAIDGNISLLAGLIVHHQQESHHQQEPHRQQGLGTSLPSGQPILYPITDNLAAGLETIYLRQDRQRFGPVEGVLEGDAVRRRLTAHFGQHHTFAATELEQYASCPFRFFIERILKIEPLADLMLEFDVLERGRAMHDVLSDFHRWVNDRLGRPASPLELDAAEFDTLLCAAIDKWLPPEPANSLQAALREINRRQVKEWLAQYRGQLEAYDAQWKDIDRPLRPELFEVSFGRNGQSGPSTDRAFQIPLTESDAEESRQDGASASVRIAGRIDRVDTGIVAGRDVFNVIDYKTGGPIALGPESVRAGTTLQLPLYALAAMELLLADRDPLPWQAGYWYLRRDGFNPRKVLRMYSHDDGQFELNGEWEEIRDSLADAVMGLAANIRTGRFPVCSADDRCTGYCPYSTICRINQVRSLEKTCQPTTIQ